MGEDFIFFLCFKKLLINNFKIKIMKLESLENFMSSTLNEDIMATIYGGTGRSVSLLEGGATKAREQCVSDIGAGGSNTGCITYESDYNAGSMLVFVNAKDVDKTC